jgi:hypothetical protein
VDTVGSAQKKPFVTDEDISKPFMERIFKPLFKSMAVKLVRPGKKDESPEKSRQAGRLRKMLAQAGFGFSTAEYGVIRLFVILLSAAVFVPWRLRWARRQAAPSSARPSASSRVMFSCASC